MLPALAALQGLLPLVQRELEARVALMPWQVVTHPIIMYKSEMWTNGRTQTGLLGGAAGAGGAGGGEKDGLGATVGGGLDGGE